MYVFFSCWQATVCLCGRDTCNGPSLPPKDFLENESDIIDIDEVVKEMNEVKEVKPAPVASKASRDSAIPIIFLIWITVRTCYRVIVAPTPILFGT